jgi:hypothetical protein
MKRHITIFIFASFLCCCAQESKEKIPFTFTPERRLMSVPITIQGVKGNMLFDTGCGISLSLDTSYAKRIEPFKSVTRHIEGTTKGGYATGSSSTVDYYTGQLKVGIGSHTFDKKEFSVGNYREIFNLLEFDGIMGLTNIDSLNVWEFNYEDNYIHISQADSFKVEKDYIELPLKWDDKGKIYTTLPIMFRSSCGTLLSASCEFMIDTGSISDVTFIQGTEEANILDLYKDSAQWLWNRHFWDVDMIVCNKLLFNAARVYIYDGKPKETTLKRVLGLNFFKRFNIYFDMKNDKLYLKPIKDFYRITQGKKPWFQLSNKIQGEKVIIDYIADYKDNEAIKAGFRIGDEVISINGIEKIHNLSKEQEDRLLSEEVWNYVVRRKGKLLNLTLHRHLDKQIDD